MKSRIFGIVLMAGSLLVLSCSPSWNIYSDSMFRGKRLLREQQYAEARDAFVHAAEAQKWPMAYAFAATASYKLNDLASAQRYVNEAENLAHANYSYPRVLGYKALILLKEGREKEGLEALQRYADLLRVLSSPMGARDVEIAMRQMPLDLSALEKLIDQQVYQYESDIEQALTTGTGFYARPMTLRPQR